MAGLQKSASLQRLTSPAGSRTFGRIYVDRSGFLPTGQDYVSIFIDQGCSFEKFAAQVCDALNKSSFRAIDVEELSFAYQTAENGPWTDILATEDVFALVDSHFGEESFRLQVRSTKRMAGKVSTEEDILLRSPRAGKATSPVISPSGSQKRLASYLSAFSADVETANQYLASLKMADAMKQNQVAIVSAKSPILQTLHALDRPGVEALPICRLNVNESIDEVLGLVDSYDIICLIVDNLPPPGSGKQVQALDVVRVDSHQAMNASRVNQYVPAYFDNMSTALSHMARGHQRFMTLDEYSEPRCVYSQHTVLSFLAKEVSAKSSPLKSIFEATVGKAGLGSPAVLTCPSHATVIDALRIMRKRHALGVALVDKEKKLVTSFGVGNIVQLWKSQADSFGMTCHSLLSQSDPAALTPPVTTADATVGALIQQMAALKVLQVFQVDASGLPTHVILPVDIFSLFQNH
eukprot:TRINITY_DN854_c0_g1_i1.p1 TRINITY_DN854_c0_g1~~TRINITY_DN854_c0_g1_i1.p1  ORF type:complete len:464 (+),score=104.58 TRINITY_DN854_c0_g1_i1:12-1403(+)